MSTFVGIVVENTEKVRAAIGGMVPNAGLSRASETSPPEPDVGHLLVSVHGGFSVERDTSELAAELAKKTSSSVLAVMAQTSADAYVLEEHTEAGLARRLVYSRDGGGWAPPDGPERPWEAGFHFALPRKEFTDHLIDDEWSDLEVQRALVAFEKRDVSLLPRLPSPSIRQLHAFLESLGAGEPRVEVDRRGLVARWLGM